MRCAPQSTCALRARTSCKRSFSHLQSIVYVEGNVWQILQRLAACEGSSTTAFKLELGHSSLVSYRR